MEPDALEMRLRRRCDLGASFNLSDEPNEVMSKLRLSLSKCAGFNPGDCGVSIRRLELFSRESPSAKSENIPTDDENRDAFLHLLATPGAVSHTTQISLTDHHNGAVLGRVSCPLAFARDAKDISDDMLKMWSNLASTWLASWYQEKSLDRELTWTKLSIVLKSL